MATRVDTWRHVAAYVLCPSPMGGCNPEEDEQHLSYNGGGVVYLLKARHLIHPYSSYFFFNGYTLRICIYYTAFPPPLSAHSFVPKNYKLQPHPSVSSREAARAH